MRRPERTRTARAIEVFCVLALLASVLGACDKWPFKKGPVPVQKPKTGSIFDRSPKACDLACAVATASRHEISLLFGVKELPPALGWGRRYVDGAGFGTFRECIGETPAEGDTLTECFEKAHKACIVACRIGEQGRLDRKNNRHRERDAARKKARQKPTAP